MSAPVRLFVVVAVPENGFKRLTGAVKLYV